MKNVVLILTRVLKSSERLFFLTELTLKWVSCYPLKPVPIQLIFLSQQSEPYSAKGTLLLLMLSPKN